MATRQLPVSISYLCCGPCPLHVLLKLAACFGTSWLGEASVCIGPETCDSHNEDL